MSAEKKYADIIELESPEPERHARMSRLARAAQFAPFAALVGYGEEIAEAARVTEKRIQPSEEEAALIGERLSEIADSGGKHLEVSIRYFKPDGRKDGGEYIERICRVRLVDGVSRELTLESGERVPFGDILRLEVLVDGCDLP